MMKKFKLFLLGCFLFITSERGVYAQVIEFGIGVGASTYWGDLNSSDFNTNLKNSGFAVQLTGRAIYKSMLGARLNLAYGSVNGNDSRSSAQWQKERNLSFHSNIVELAAIGEFYFFGFNEETFFAPYIALGVAGFYFDPRTYQNGAEKRLQPLGTEGQGMPGYPDKYSLVSMSFPFGGGAKFKINDQINLSAELLYRRAITDYLDDVSSNYVNFAEFTGPDRLMTAMLANRMHEFRGTSELVSLPTGSQRGGSQVNDYYFFTMIGLNIKIGNGFKGSKGYKSNCPKF